MFATVNSYLKHSTWLLVLIDFYWNTWRNCFNNFSRRLLCWGENGETTAEETVACKDQNPSTNAENFKLGEKGSEQRLESNKQKEQKKKKKNRAKHPPKQEESLNWRYVVRWFLNSFTHLSLSLWWGKYTMFWLYKLISFHCPLCRASYEREATQHQFINSVKHIVFTKNVSRSNKSSFASLRSLGFSVRCSRCHWDTATHQTELFQVLNCISRREPASLPCTNVFLADRVVVFFPHFFLFGIRCSGHCDTDLVF